MKNTSASVAVLLLLLICSRAVFSCTSYTHLWQPVKETKTSFINSYDLVEFLKDKIRPFDKISRKWVIAINPASDMGSEVKKHVASAVLNIMEPKKYTWDDKLSPFDDFQPKENTAYVWVDIVNPTHLKFIWQDMNGPPLSMFRMGEFDTASIRMLIQSDKKEVLLIDEFPYQNSFESDIMTPTWTTLGGNMASKSFKKNCFNEKT